MRSLVTLLRSTLSLTEIQLANNLLNKIVLDQETSSIIINNRHLLVSPLSFTNSNSLSHSLTTKLNSSRNTIVHVHQTIITSSMTKCTD